MHTDYRTYDVAAFSLVGRPHIVQTHPAGEPDQTVDWYVTDIQERRCPLHGKHVRVFYDSPGGGGACEFSDRRDRVTVARPSEWAAA